VVYIFAGISVLILITAIWLVLHFKFKASHAQKGIEDQKLLFGEMQTKFSDTFKALSADALKSNNESFMNIANVQMARMQESAQEKLSKKEDAIFQMVKPVKESLEKVDNKISQLEQARAKADESVYQQVRSLMEAQKDLRSETSNLVAALRAPQARGRWGEMQLKRVVEMAGMLEQCDFTQQTTVRTDEGRLRPDLIVKLPGGKTVVVDSKTPLSAYLDALQEKVPELRLQRLKEHALHVRKHIEQLSRKSYWAQFKDAPEFVVLFLPGEAFFSAALEQDPSLIEVGVAQNVIIATPTTLISLLRAVAYGWRQEKLAENARAIGALGRELYKRVADMSGHMTKLGRSLQSSVETYNKTVGTLESRVLVTARRFEELDSAHLGTDIPAIAPVDQATRELRGPDNSTEN
jgi:DNA recombination protein RmuC